MISASLLGLSLWVMAAQPDAIFGSEASVSIPVPTETSTKPNTSLQLEYNPTSNAALVSSQAQKKGLRPEEVYTKKAQRELSVPTVEELNSVPIEVITIPESEEAASEPVVETIPIPLNSEHIVQASPPRSTPIPLSSIEMNYSRWWNHRAAKGLGLAAMALALMGGAHMARTRLARRGFLPYIATSTVRVGALTALVFSIWGGTALLPGMPTEVMWAGLGAAVLIILVAAQSVLPDVVTGWLIFYERRIHSGMQVEGDEFSGTIVRTGWRSTILRTPRGYLELPNRRLLAGPLRTSGELEHELILRLKSDLLVDMTRRQIEDAVLASPWTPPCPEVKVHRDPTNPHQWVVKAHLLDPRFAPAFDAELPERLECWLNNQAERLVNAEIAAVSEPAPD